MTAIQYIAARAGLELNQGFSNRPQQLLECLVPAKLRSKASISHDDKYYVIDIDGIKIRLEFIGRFHLVLKS
jgi:hypothetical protein